MQSRLEIQKIAPQVYRTMATLETYVRNSGLEEALILLVKLRASQINGCSYCIDMHTKDARANDESEQRLYALTAWRETPFFSDRERAALNWTEALTLISESHAPDSIYEDVRLRFTAGQPDYGDCRDQRVESHLCRLQKGPRNVRAELEALVIQAIGRWRNLLDSACTPQMLMRRAYENSGIQEGP